MSYSTVNKVKVPLPSNPDYWVEIKTSLEYGELKDFAEYGGENGLLKPGHKLKLIITDWNLDDDNGKLEINEDNIERLKEQDLVAVVDAYNSTQEDDTKKKDSPKPSTATTAAAK